jgi:hypothetical protein
VLSLLVLLELFLLPEDGHGILAHIWVFARR